MSYDRSPRPVRSTTIGISIAFGSPTGRGPSLCGKLACHLDRRNLRMLPQPGEDTLHREMEPEILEVPCFLEPPPELAGVHARFAGPLGDRGANLRVGGLQPFSFGH